MIALISDNPDDIAELCRKYRVKRLDLCGSAATGSFDPTTSDIDVIVDLRGTSETYPDGSWDSPRALRRYSSDE